MAELSRPSITFLKKKFPSIVVVKNPMDLVGDADTERYKIALEQCVKDKNIDIILAVVLSQTPLVEKENLIQVLQELNKKSKKPIITITTGSAYAQMIKKSIEEAGLPCFVFPNNAVRAIKAFVEYYKK